MTEFHFLPSLARICFELGGSFLVFWFSPLVPTPYSSSILFTRGSLEILVSLRDVTLLEFLEMFWEAGFEKLMGLLRVNLVVLAQG